MITDKGITLIGEAAQAYIRYKYFDSCLDAAALVLILGGLVLASYKLMKMAMKDLQD